MTVAVITLAVALVAIAGALTWALVAYRSAVDELDSERKRARIADIGRDIALATRDAAVVRATKAEAEAAQARIVAERSRNAAVAARVGAVRVQAAAAAGASPAELSRLVDSMLATPLDRPGAVPNATTADGDGDTRPFAVSVAGATSPDGVGG